MKHRLFLIVALLSSSIIFGQNNKGYEEGSIVLASGETLKGWLKFKSGEEIKNRLTIKLTEEDKRTYKPADITSFSTESASFISYEIEKEGVFMKVLADGAIQLYELQYTFSKGGSDSYKYEMYIRKKGEKELVALKQGSWKKQVTEYINDNNSIVQQIEKGKLKLDELPALIIQYNEQKE